MQSSNNQESLDDRRTFIEKSLKLAAAGIVGTSLKDILITNERTQFGESK